MAYAWAGPMGLVQEAASSIKPLSTSGRLGKPSKPSRRSYEAAAYSNGPPHSSSAPSAAGQTSNRKTSSPQRGRGAEPQSPSLWGLLGSLTRSSLLPRALTLTSSPSTAAPNPATQPALATTESSLDGLDSAQPDAAKEPKPLLHKFLAGSDKVEVSYAALLADLSDLAYDISLLKADELADKHNLQLVSTSSSEKEGPITREAWYAQLKEQRRSMSPDPRPAAQPEAHHAQHPAAHHAPALSDAAAAVARTLLSGEVEHANVPQHEAGVLTPSVSLVAISSLEESSPRTSFSGPGDPTLQIPIVTFMPSPPSTPRGSTAQGPTAFDGPNTDVPKGSAGMPVVPLTSPHTQGELTSSQAGALTTAAEPPAAWFACDDPITKIRYLVIQGSTSLEHWQINLQFEPVIFEDPALGVRVHRGVYMAALQLYDDLVPLVRQHLATSSFASITFTGHSLGGSLATVLMLLMVSRGVIPPDSVSPTYTFGAPAVFCGGAGAFSTPSRCHDCGLDCPEAHHSATHATGASAGPQCSHRPRGLFAQVGLGEEHIVNVIMHRDIVPRAFACDYMAVADLLVQWMPSFKSLATLQGPANSHKSLYSFLGRVAVLQPDVSCPFVNPSDARHPHLPSAPGLYRLVAPAPRLRVHALHGTFDLPIPAPGLDGSDEDDLYSLGLMDDSSMIASMATVSRPRPYTPAPVRYATVEEEEEDQPMHRNGRGGSGGRSNGARAAAAGTGAGRKDVGPPATLKDAVLHFMNNPHPLTTLTEYGAYGPNGSISRYHNPRNYTLGLLALFGKAPHQQPLQPSSQTLPSLLLPTPGCTSTPREASASPGNSPMHAQDGTRAALGDGLDGWQEDEHMCAVPHEMEMSPEARRLIRQSPDAHSPARSRPAGRAHRAPSAGRRPTGAGGERQQQARSAKPTTVQTRLPMLPSLSSLPASLGSLLGYKSSNSDN